MRRKAACPPKNACRPQNPAAEGVSSSSYLAATGGQPHLSALATGQAVPPKPSLYPTCTLRAPPVLRSSTSPGVELIRPFHHHAIPGHAYVRMAPYGLLLDIGSLSEAGTRFQTFKWLPKQEDFRTFLMSEECAEMAEMVANLA